MADLTTLTDEQIRACGGVGDRSTPAAFADCAIVVDRQGEHWKYSEPADVWKLVDDQLGPGSVAPHSACSYQRLVAGFGPLAPVPEDP